MDGKDLSIGYTLPAQHLHPLRTDPILRNSPFGCSPESGGNGGREHVSLIRPRLDKRLCAGVSASNRLQGVIGETHPNSHPGAVPQTCRVDRAPCLKPGLVALVVGHYSRSGEYDSPSSRVDSNSTTPYSLDARAQPKTIVSGNKHQRTYYPFRKVSGVLQ